jgi:long-subunit acyl-CoA synthetase (AMP-forming)
LRRTAKQPDGVAVKIEQPDGSLKEVKWAQYHEDVKNTARALIKIGMKQHQTVNIIGFNSYVTAAAMQCVCECDVA